MVIVAPSKHDYAVIAPDGGWGWLVVLSSFYIQLVVDGVLLCFGVVLKEMAAFYKIPRSRITFIGSMTFGSHLFFGPICTVLLKSLGERKTVIGGSILSGAGLLVAYFEPPYYILFVSQGIVTGIGLCLANMSSIIITTLYFSRKRIFALAIVVCGTGAGTIVFTVVSLAVLKSYGWQSVFLLESMICFSMTIAALAYVPLSPMEIRTEPGAKGGAALKILSIPVEEEVLVDSGSQVEKERVFYISDPKAITSDRRSVESLNSVAEYNEIVLESIATYLTQAHVPRHGRLHRCWRRFLKAICPCAACGTEQQRIVVLEQRAATVVTSDERRPSHGICQLGGCDEEDLVPPSSHWRKIKFRTLRIFDIRPLLTWDFLIFCCCGTLSYSGIFIVFTYEKVRIEHHSGTEDDVKEYLIFLGASNIICRFLLGFTAFCPRINFHALNILGHILGGIGTVASGLNKSKSYQFVMGFAFTFAFGCFALFPPIILYELVGFKCLQKGTGFSMLFIGFFAAMAPWASGMLAEVLDNTEVNFYIAGVMILLSGLLFFFLAGEKLSLGSRR